MTACDRAGGDRAVPRGARAPKHAHQRLTPRGPPLRRDGRAAAGRIASERARRLTQLRLHGDGPGADSPNSWACASSKWGVDEANSETVQRPCGWETTITESRAWAGPGSGRAVRAARRAHEQLARGRARWTEGPATRDRGPTRKPGGKTTHVRSEGGPRLGPSRPRPALPVTPRARARVGRKDLLIISTYQEPRAGERRPAVASRGR